MTPLEAILAAEGYVSVRKLPTGEYIGVRRYMFTVGLCVGLDESGMQSRYCYPDALSAVLAAIEWDGLGDPSGPWIKHKGAPGGDRCQPQRFRGIPIVEARP